MPRGHWRREEKVPAGEAGGRAAGSQAGGGGRQSLFERGKVFLALAAAMALSGLTDDDAGERREILRATIIPVVVGAAVLAYARFSARGCGEGGRVASNGVGGASRAD